MITVQLNRTDFEYDIHSLVKAFFPKERVAFIPYKEDPGEVISFHIVMTYLSDSIDIKFYKTENSAEETPFLENSCEADFADRKDTKNRLKQLLYTMLSGHAGRALPWGTLTGIRPTKIPLNMLEEGKSEEEIRAFMKETYFASDEKIDLSLAVARRERRLLERIDYQKGYSLYVGIPFCPSTCLYCSFTSYPLSMWESQVDAYLDALEKEIDFTAEHMKDRTLNAVYIGGGTPTTLSQAQLERLITKIQGSFDLSSCLEFTVEAGRPDSITREKLEVIRSLGITRISINPQTMKDETLKIIGRHHTVAQAVESFQLAREIGFDDINMDLIIGLPNESYEDVEATMQQVKALAPDNLTVHSLALKRAARLNMFRDEYRDLTFENTDEIVDLTARYAAEMGLAPYYLYRQKNMAGNFENVGYAAEGKAGVYNILIMEDKQTIMALGAGATTKFIDGPDAKPVRVENVKDIKIYLERIDDMIEKKRSAMVELGYIG